MAAFVVLTWHAVGEADADLDPASDAWNGLHRFVRLAVETGYPLEIPSEVSMRRLSAQDAVVLFHPTEPVPVPETAAFLRRGGRLAVIDDFGASDDLLASFQIVRSEIVETADALRLRDNAAILLARPTGTHPLTRAIRAIVTNRPVQLHHNVLEPVFLIGRASPLVLTGAVGQGRLVVMGDSSLFTNQMLALEGNRMLARNLLAYLREGHDGRLILATARTRLSAPWQDRLGAPVDALRSLLTRMSQVKLPPAWLRVVTWISCVIAFAWLVVNTVRRSPYTRASWPLLGATGADGLAGRSDDLDYTEAALTWRVELEAALRARLQATHDVPLHELIALADARQVGAGLGGQATAVFAALDGIVRAHERAERPTRVDAQRFRDLVRSGERILAAVGPKELT